jgi:predicted AAA+ superfamily ATPase
MTFEEYLCAAGQSQFAEFIRSFSLGDEVPPPVHEALNEHVRTFCVVGGMPAVTAAWLKRLSFGDCDTVKQSLLSTLEDDFGKYGSRLAREYLVKVFRKLPLLVSRRFKYVNVSREERARTIRSALDLLCAARLGFRVCHASCNGIPLRAEVKEETFKTLFLDVGLMTGACGLSLLDFEKTNDLNLVNQGAVSEQFVGQHLLYSQPSYKPPELHYWVREKSSSSAEVDYVVALGSDIVPIEVKAGKTGRLRSLQLFMDTKPSTVAVRFNSDLPSVVDSPILGSGTRRGVCRLISLPF